MNEGWIQVTCATCDREWQEQLSELPGPDAQFTCTNCQTDAPISNFVKTTEGYEILKQFHQQYR